MENSKAIEQVRNYILHAEMNGKVDKTDSWYSTYQLLEELQEKAEDDESNKEGA